jgi:hypothetical protein
MQQRRYATFSNRPQAGCYKKVGIDARIFFPMEMIMESVRQKRQSISLRTY